MGKPVKASIKLQPTADTVKRAQELLKAEIKIIGPVLVQPKPKLGKSPTDYLLNWDKNKLICLVNNYFDYHNEIGQAYELRLGDYLERINKQKEIDFDCYFDKESKATTQTAK